MSKLTLALIAALTATTAGCGKKKDACTTTLTAMSDQQMAEGKAMMEKLSADDKKKLEPEMKKAMAEADKKTAMLIKACQDTKWSDDVLKCLGEAKDNKSGSACMEKLTPEQVGAMMKLMGPDDDKPAAAGDKPAADKSAADKPAGDKPAAAAAGGGGLPQECQDYKAVMEQVMKCDKMASVRDAMKQGYDAMSQGWADMANMPDEAKKAMADGCKQGVDAMKQSMTAMGC